ncbi:MAG TPA: hypothetical protein VMU48_19560 [Terracidiphilus sp.]|nr:hypothetical protein [Terracidiphilus sp.]
MMKETQDGARTNQPFGGFVLPAVNAARTIRAGIAAWRPARICAVTLGH